MALLDPFTQPLSSAQAAHLLRRTTFGPTPAQIKAFSGKLASTAVQQLLADQPIPAPPLDIATTKPFNDLPFQKENGGRLVFYNKSWWVALMVNQPVSLLEKMTLFWSNHFVTTQQTVNDYRYMYQYNTLLRQYALGNFRAFVIAITQNPAMLRYLNGNANIVGNANENYARELQELFVVGRNGGYTEDDVRTAARVLTGWSDSGYRNETTGEVSSTFTLRRHDTTDKVFSAAYGNTVIKGRNTNTAGLDELNDLVDMFLRNPESARYICRRLYRWFVNYDITPAIETNVIGPLADVFRQNKYEIKPVLATLFGSQHFFDTAIRGAIIKSPVDLVVGTIRFFGNRVPDPTPNPTAFYQLAGYLYARINEQQQNLLDPPNVFGWTAYYQTGYYQQWINSSTIGLRGAFTEAVSNGTVKVAGKPLLDPLPFVRALSKPEDPAALVDEVTSLLLAVTLSQAQKDFLTDSVLLNNLPRYEWTGEWGEYAADPTNVAKAKAIQMKINIFLSYVFRMAEYQVS